MLPKHATEKQKVHQNQKGSNVTIVGENHFYLFFDYGRSIVDFKFIKPRQTVNQHCYLVMLRRLCDDIRKKHRIFGCFAMTILQRMMH